jgi:cell division protein FtsW
MRTEAHLTVPRLRVVRPDEVPPAVARARAVRSLRRSVTMLTLSTFALTVVGVVMVLSASSVSSFAQYGSSFLFFKRQLIYAVIGAVVAVAASRLDYRAWRRAWPALTAVTAVLLILVLHPSTGQIVGGSARWISFGRVTLQPSELAKFTVVTAGAALLAANYRHLKDPVRLALPLMAVVGPLALLIMLQPDLGTTMVVVAIVLVLLFVVGVRLRLLVSTCMVGLIAGMGLILSAGYRRTRFLSFLHPWADPRNSGYQIVQSLIALGSGHWVGVGLGASRQKWMFVPNAHTDFIFSILGEETGLIGELIVIALFGAFIYAGIRIAIRAPDTFGRLLAAGIVGWLSFQAIVNMGAVTGLLPITGIPLPFMSYGGSSLIVSLVAVGVLHAIGRAGLADLGAGRIRSGGGRRAAAPVSSNA